MTDAQPMTPAALAAIRERAERATPGLCLAIRGAVDGFCDAGAGLAAVRDNRAFAVCHSYAESDLTEYDFRLFFHAKSDVLALLAEVDRLRGEARRAALSALVADAQEQGGY